MKSLTLALGHYAHSAAVEDGRAPVDGYVTKPVEVRPIIAAYRRMIRDLEFDVCELAPVSYLMARDAGIPLVAIPVFLNRRFHHGDIQCSPNSGIRTPRDLEGRRVGVRAYSVSTGVWARGVLTEEYGVNLSQVTWVVDDDDHIEGRSPDNVERVEDGRSLGELLAASEIDAAFTGNAGTGRAGNPATGWEAAADEPASTYPLFADHEVLERDYYLRTGIYPLHSVVVLRAELVEQDPDLPTKLYAAFCDGKRAALDEDPDFTALPRLARQGAMIGSDPIPYGVDSNAATLAALQRFSADQGLLRGQPEALFAPGDYPDC
ncbi:ABC transporter substrate-binding protein [Nocardioides sp. Kera G14]|uniref:ABC transporter substrate-binding protein n=1 Tax=Nocardioides sp. Kera G14 TaxID=2884264 RepID=UPI001D128ED0|nr:ABC transporter substrate-binding protein [Nocardioides sp. Kera G14]UDY23933.1 ABC transporter substrate-binding protein [Nocardioides sp. Kera G14]